MSTLLSDHELGIPQTQNTMPNKPTAESGAYSYNHYHGQYSMPHPAGPQSGYNQYTQVQHGQYQYHQDYRSQQLYNSSISSSQPSHPPPSRFENTPNFSHLPYSDNSRCASNSNSSCWGNSLNSISGVNPHQNPDLLWSQHPFPVSAPAQQSNVSNSAPSNNLANPRPNPVPVVAQSQGKNKRKQTINSKEDDILNDCARPTTSDDCEIDNNNDGEPPSTSYDIPLPPPDNIGKLSEILTIITTTEMANLPENVHPRIDDSSDSDNDHRSDKIRITKLRRDNWPEWNKSFKHLITGRGDEEVFDPIWCEQHKLEKRFRKKTSNAYTLLELCVSADLQSVVQSVDTFSKAMEGLALACGERSLIKLGDKIYSLTHFDYVPGTSIADHISKFQSMYTSLKSAQISIPNTKVDTAMAGIFFLKSFRFDDTLTGLIQTLYDMDPFTFEKIAIRMNAEHNRIEQARSIGSSSINALSSKPFVRPNKEKFKAVDKKF
ncbi:hypothetical protein PTTG_29628 [Puccinia triticina 1-1 BBBD Race 1]|uniref:Uncharacterized protein n=1 Tax=Puccinia triticina (isolate 1-1 / race 1 (BBBD)) TaxID=630390 RepID=A0A180G3H7_PUCT1|nr:hypothetical protein PTTG_29628 [Puccinia triticina 1-1 BBBD Race 1]